MNHLANFAVVWVHTFAGLIYPVQGLLVLTSYGLRPRPSRIWLGAHAVFAVTILAWGATQDFSVIDEWLTWLKLPTLRTYPGDPGASIESTMLMWTGSGEAYPTNSLARALGPVRPYFDYLRLALVVFCAASPFVFRSSRSAPGNAAVVVKRRFAFYFLLWFAVPTVSLFVLSYLWRPCFLHRYLLFVTPPLYLLFGFGLTTLKPRYETVLALLAALLAGVQFVYSYPGPARVAWSRAVEKLEANGDDSSPVIVTWVTIRDSLRFHGIPKYRIESVLSSDEAPDVVDVLLAEHERVWIVVTYPEELDALSAQLKELPVGVEFSDLSSGSYLGVLCVTADPSSGYRRPREAVDRADVPRSPPRRARRVR